MNKILKHEKLLSFIIAVVTVTLAFAFIGIYPFGPYSAAFSDMRAQFLDVTAGVFGHIKRGESLFIDHTALGTNLYAVAAYLIFDPFKILFLFFDVRYYQEVYLFIIIIKYGLIALCMSHYLKKSGYVRLAGLMNVALAVMYAFGSFCIKSEINEMWLINIALLPIVLLGIEKAADKGDIRLLYFSYLFCLAGNYYLAFMNGIFAALYFVFYCAVKNKGLKESMGALLLCALGAVLAGGTAAVILLPAFANISSGYVDMVQTSAFKPFIEWKPNEIAQGLALFQDTPATYVTLHAFAGVFPLMFAVLLFFTSGIGKREKISAGVFLLVMLLSLLIRPVYLVWHIFRDPTSFYGRFVYCIGFLLVMLAARCVETLEIRHKKLLPIPALAVFLAAFYGVSAAPSVWLLEMLLCVLVLVVLYTLFAAFYGKTGTLLALAVLFEAAAMCFVGTAKLKAAHGTYSRAEDMRAVDDTHALMSEIDDDGFYRMTDVNSVAVNRPLSMGYNSLETFSSQTNQQSLEKLSQLGMYCPYDYRISANYFNNTVGEGLFGVKYIMAVGKDSVSEDDIGRRVYGDGGVTSALRLNSDNYELAAETGNGYLYRNKTAFPLLFGVNKAAITSSERFWDQYSGGFYDEYSAAYSCYANQAMLLNDMFGTEYSLYSVTELDIDPDSMKNIRFAGNPEDVYRTLQLTSNESGYAANEDEMGSVTYVAEADEDAEYLVDIRSQYLLSDGVQTMFAYSANGAVLKNMYNEHNDLLLADIGPYKKGDRIEIKLQTLRSLEAVMPKLLKLNADEFNDIYERAQAGALKNIRQEKGDIIAESDFDKETLVFSSLSYDKGFRVLVDGSEAEKVKIADAFLGFYVPAGEHDVKISYISPGFKAGAVLSLLFAFVSAAVLIFGGKKQKETPKTEKTE